MYLHHKLTKKMCSAISKRLESELWIALSEEGFKPKDYDIEFFKRSDGETSVCVKHKETKECIFMCTQPRIIIDEENHELVFMWKAFETDDLKLIKRDDPQKA